MIFDPSQHSTADVLQYCLDHPDEVTAVAMRELEHRKRGNLLASLISHLSAQSDFETRIRKLWIADPGQSLDQALRRIDGNTDVLATTASIQERAEWVLEQRDIVPLIENKKINAIKEVRAISGMGLKEAKEAVEYAAALQRRGYLSKAERRQLEIEEQEAIASILGTT
jgi:ribosomal protein L7/L12